LRAAIENGADAVYFGLDSGFNARARAANFRLEELPEVMDLLRRRGLKGYVALNTLVFSGELERLEETVRQVAAAGADAVMVQDLGLARLIRQVCPELPLHASTQMTLTSAECLAAVESFGFQRVILPRELSIREIAKIHAQTRIELEAFVHGALCVAYSGQCLTSESLGGRSANRGQCAQACRTPYQLVCDGKTLDLGQQKYLLSPQDLAAYDLLPQLLAAGVSALKIEGRLKTAEYVANITRHYRTAIETLLAGRSVEFTPRQVEEMEVSFSRGFSHGWLEGCDHKALVPGRWSSNRGVLVGEVRSVGRDRVEIELCRPLRRGDGLVFEGDRSQEAEAGGRVYEVFQQGRSLAETVPSGLVELTFAHGAIDFPRLYAGQKAWKTDDPQLTRRLRQTYAGPDPQCRVPLDLAVEARVGSPLLVTGRAASGATCRVVSDSPLEEARKHPLTEPLLREQLGRLGGTSYELAALDARIEGRPMVPLSVLGKLRHAMVAGLDASLARPPQRSSAAGSVLAALRATLPHVLPLPSGEGRGEGTYPRQTTLDQTQLAGPPGLRSDTATTVAYPAPTETVPRLHVLCRSLTQLEAVLACGVRSVMVDFQDIRQYAAAVESAHRSGAAILLATPRIQKPGERGIFRVLLRHGADGILVRNLAGLAYYVQQGVPAVADFSLNATNELTAQWLIDRGAARVTASYDMNRDQLLQMVAAVPPAWLEVVIHQHMPMFHMEHCVFCAVLSPGRNKTDCGRPCDRHQVRLRDRIGKEHPLRADVGCRNTLYNATPQSAAEVIPQLIEHGLRDFRIELVDDAEPAHPAEVISLYRDLLHAKISGREVWSRLRASNRVGVTRGTMEEHRNPEAML
jgi:putative protease